MYFNAKEFGQRVKTRRKELEMTQEELADKLGLLTPQHISRIERGVSACSIDMLLELSEALHISTDFLLTGKKAPIDDLKAQLQDTLKRLNALVAIL